jgi:hypothetical protein
MAKGKYVLVTNCNMHGSISTKNETTKWIKVQTDKHPRRRDGKSGCPLCRRENVKIT